jgi:hypothetical protein
MRAPRVPLSAADRAALLFDRYATGIDQVVALLRRGDIDAFERRLRAQESLARELDLAWTAAARERRGGSGTAALGAGATAELREIVWRAARSHHLLREMLIAERNRLAGALAAGLTGRSAEHAWRPAPPPPRIDTLG